MYFLIPGHFPYSPELPQVHNSKNLFVKVYPAYPQYFWKEGFQFLKSAGELTNIGTLDSLLEKDI